MIDVESLYDEAVDFCSRTSGKPYKEIIALLKEGDRDNHSKLRYSLAKSLCRHVAGEYSGIKAVYLFGSTDHGGASFVSDIDLIFWVDRKTESLDCLLRSLDDALTKYYIDVVGPRVEKMTGLLDCKIVTDEEVEKKEGFAGVITSVNEPHTKIYEAEARAYA